MKRIVLFFLMATFMIPAWGWAQQFNQREVHEEIRKANRLERNRQYKQAVEICESLYESYPGDRMVTATLTRLYRNIDPQDIITRYETLLKQRPNDPNYRAWLGEAYLRTGDRDKAMTHFKKIMESGQADRGAYTQIARAFMAGGFIEEAIEIYESAREREGDPSLFAHDLAQLYAQQTQYGAATREYFNWLNKQPNQWAYVEQRLFTFLEDLNENDTDRDTLTRQESEILAAAEAQVQLNPENDALYRVLGDIYLELGQEENAFEAYARMEELRPQEGKTLIEFGNHCIKRKQYETAIQAFNKLIELYPKSKYVMEARLKVADSHIHKGAFDDAVAAFNAIQQQFPNTSQAREAMIKVADLQLDYLKNPDEAIQIYQSYLEKYPRSDFAGKATFRLGEALLRSGSLDKAESIWCNYDVPASARPAKRALRFTFPGMDNGQSQVLITSEPDEIDPGVQSQFFCALSQAMRADFGPGLDALDEFIKQHGNDDLTNDALEWSFFLNQFAQTAPERLSLYLEAFGLELQYKIPAAIDKYSELVLLPDSPDQEEKAVLVDYALYKQGMLKQELYQDNVEQAIADFRMLVTYFPESHLAAQAQMHIAEIYADDLNQKEQAISEYEIVLTQFSDSIYVEEARRRIQVLAQKQSS